MVRRVLIEMWGGRIYKMHAVTPEDHFVYL